MRAVALGVAVLVVLELWAVHVGYPLRVTSDVPTYLALLRGLAAHPLSPQSPFLPLPGIASPHATPYMTGLALLWHAVAFAVRGLRPDGRRPVPRRGRIGVTLATLAMIALYARRVAGPRQGLLAVPVVLVLFGPHTSSGPVTSPSTDFCTRASTRRTSRWRSPSPRCSRSRARRARASPWPRSSPGPRWSCTH